MLSELKKGPRVVGTKQVARAVNDGRALLVFFAQDADSRVTEPLAALCREKQIPVSFVSTMRELGAACAIAVGAAVAAVTR